MIEIVCDNCEKPFQADDEAAGTKVACPLCGDVNRVPADAAGTGAGPRRPSPVEPRDPPAEEGPETEIRVVRPAMFRARPFRFILILLLVVGGAVLGVWSLVEKRSALGWVSLAPIVFGLLWWLKWWIATHWWIKVTITNRRTVKHEGIVRRHSTEVLHDHVRSVDINQTFVQRVFRVGYIGIDSAGQDDIEIEIHDIPDPYEVKRIIDRYRTM